jgi:ribosomal protein S27E
MTGVASIPAETDLLCEGCGYVLSGLPRGGDARCPECGKPIAESEPGRRAPAAWEARPSLPTLLSTSLHVLLRPTHFYRTLATRGPAAAARRFAAAHWWVAALLFAVAADTHFRAFIAARTLRYPYNLLEVAAFAVFAYCFLALTTRLAGWLTHWEASYRGYRLPRPVVERGMYYHAVHYLPVAVVTALTVVGYALALSRGVVGVTSTVKYLYVLSAEVVLAAVYLFRTYWIGMRNMMFANA